MRYIAFCQIATGGGEIIAWLKLHDVETSQGDIIPRALPHNAPAAADHMI